jgi:flagellar hook assembly protein FlgD
MDISMVTNEGIQASVFVYDYTGKLVKRVVQNEALTSGKLNATWDGTNESGQSVNKGVYFLSVTIDGKVYTKQVVKQ